MSPARLLSALQFQSACRKLHAVLSETEPRVIALPLLLQLEALAARDGPASDAAPTST